MRRDRFLKLTLEYMSDDSTPDENGAMRVCKPAWRSAITHALERHA